MITNLLIALAASAAPSADHAASVYFDRLVNPSDYPRAALRRHEEGRVAFELAVEADGTVSGCRIVSSSGSMLLDDRTCTIMRRRARFPMPRDAAGRPVGATIAGAVDWVVPRRPLLLINPRQRQPSRLAGRGYE